MLAAINAIGHKVVDDEEVAEFLATILLARYPARLTARYGFAVEGLDGVGVIDAIAKKRGCRDQEAGRRAGPRQSGEDPLVGLPQRHTRPHQLGDTGVSRGNVVGSCRLTQSFIIRWRQGLLIIILAEQFLFDMFQGSVDFCQDKFCRSVFLEFRRIQIEYCSIFFNQAFHVSDDIAAMSNQFHHFDY